MSREDWNKLTPDEQYSVVVRLIERLQAYEKRDKLPPSVVKPSTAEEAAQMVQDAWDKAKK